MDFYRLRDRTYDLRNYPSENLTRMEAHQMRFTFFESLGRLRIAAIVLALVLGATLLPSGSAVAAEAADRRCVCQNGSGGCGGGFSFCCDFTDSGFTCGCVFLGFGGTCTTEN